MATRSYIGKQNPNGSITGIYCHWDGYPSHNGAILLKHYQDTNKIDSLLALGSLSILGPEIGEPHGFETQQEGWCKAYARDRGEKGTEAVTVNSIKAFLKKADNMGTEYAYLFMNGGWHFTPIGRSSVDLYPLTEQDCNAD